MVGRGSIRRVAIAVVGVLLATACAGTPPAVPSGSDAGSVAPPPLPSGPVDVPANLETIEASFPVAARAERDLVAQMRSEAGIAEGIGPDGEAVLASIDAAQNDYARRTMIELAEKFGVAAVLDGRTAAVGDNHRTPLPPPGLDVGLYADAEFSTTAFMAIFAELIQRAGDDHSGTETLEDALDKTAGGVRSVINVSTTVTIATGKGRAMVKVVITSAVTMFDATSGAPRGAYDATATGLFDVLACPPADGNADGRYVFTASHVLTPVGGVPQGSAKSFEAPLRLVNGPDAVLVQTELDLAATMGAQGPGTPTADGPGTPYDWGAAQNGPVVIPRGTSLGNTNLSGLTSTVTGDSPAAARPSAAVMTVMGIAYIKTLASEAERFWRSGECIELTPSKPSRNVEPEEHIDLSVDSKHKFDAADPQIDAPITGTFSGKATLEPANTPLDPPAEFTFTAGSDMGDKGTIKLEQKSRRGIGKATVEYTVRRRELTVAYDGTYTYGGNSKVQVRLRISEVGFTVDGPDFLAVRDLEITGTVHTKNPGRCEGDAPIRATIEDVEIRAIQDEADATLVRVMLKVPPTAKEYTIRCGPVDVPSPLNDILDVWKLPLRDVLVTIGTTKTVTDSYAPLGGASTKITVKEAPTP